MNLATIPAGALLLLASAQHGPAPSSNPQSAAPRISIQRLPASEYFSSSYPANAMRRGLGGQAVLECAINRDGGLDRCEVVSETPAGWGFGDAALGLSPGILATKGLPDVDGARPTIRFPVTWPTQAPHPLLQGDDTGHLLHTRWLAAPSFADLMAAYPKKQAGSGGYVALSCVVLRRSGRLGECHVLIEDPVGSGFADAARSLTGKFRASIPQAMRRNADIWTELRFRFPANPAAGSGRIIDEPPWFADTPGADTGVALPSPTPGSDAPAPRFAVLDCGVAPDLRLEGCQVIEDRGPEALTADGARKLVSGKRVSAWSEEGEPVDGARVKLTVSLPTLQR